MAIHSYPSKHGHGTKMIDYLEKKALEDCYSTFEVTDIKDDECVKDFFKKRGYELKPHPQIPDEFTARKKLK